jgi:hypothetical protein
MRKACKIWVEKPEGNLPCERPWRRWKDNTEMNLRETGWEGKTTFIWIR